MNKKNNFIGLIKLLMQFSRFASALVVTHFPHASHLFLQVAASNSDAVNHHADHHYS